ncbi:MAG: hypothetical protein M1816_002415 [Peltula sp. TS41687]|nr:MAG: hypothetical protein M1816_002415 [Peltula sp. TS41687]
MATNQQDTIVTYEELAELENDFETIELDTLRRQTRLQAPLYKKRAELVSRIPNFWPLVLEQAPPEVDQFIQPADSNVLASHLLSIDVTRFEVSLPPDPESTEGNPRSVAIKFTFSPNDWFEDEVLEKKFWYRRAKIGWAGLVSEPVRIRWKNGEDLTDGLTEAAFKAWEAEKRFAPGANESEKEQKKKTLLPEYGALMKKMDTATEGSLSFFTWFAFRGRHITAEESEESVKAESKRREGLKSGTGAPPPTLGEDDGDELDTEVFPAGEDLAVAISDDLYPGAVKYFTQAQEDDRLTDADFEEDDDSDEDDGDDEIIDLRDLVKRDKPDQGDDEDKPKRKKRKS